MVDYWYGQVLQTAGDLGLFENSVVVFLSDHGALLNEQGKWVKGPERLRTQVTHIPLIVRVPGEDFRGKRVPGFLQVPDYVPTFLGRLNVKPSSRVTGQGSLALRCRANGEPARSHRHCVRVVTTPEWNYSAIWNK